MKNVYYLILLGLFSTIFGCNKFKSDHPQSEIIDGSATELTARSIQQYSDSISKNLASLTKQTSLVYMLGDVSFYVEKYSQNNRTILLVEHAYNGGMNNSLRKYYLKNDSLVLEEVKNEIANDEAAIFKDSRTYLRNNTVFKLENRTASSQSALVSLPYIDQGLSENKNPDDAYLQNVKTLEDVVSGRDNFDLVFESITTYPDSRYLILRSKNQTNYSASILVKDRDLLIDSLLNDPINFKNQKLSFSWVVKDHEAIYVPQKR